jgi:hypothetical protein
LDAKWFGAKYFLPNSLPLEVLHTL